MSTVKRYVVIQAMTFVFGIVGPIFLIGYFAAQPDPTLKVDVLVGAVHHGG